DWSSDVCSSDLDMLGFYVTSHPLTKYLSELGKASIIDTESLLEIKEKQEVTVAGVVRTLTVKHTKSGTGIFGNLTIEDLNGSIEIVIFNDLLRKSLHLLEDKIEPVIIKGVLEPGEDRVKMRAVEIMPIKGMRSGSTVHISLGNGSLREENLVRLKEILNSYPGQALVHVHLETDHGEAVIEVEDNRVDIEDNFIYEVESLLGKNSLRLS